MVQPYITFMLITSPANRIERPDEQANKGWASRLRALVMRADRHWF